MNVRASWFIVPVALFFVLSGCFGKPGKATGEGGAAPYVGAYKEFELVLRSLSGEQKWELYPGASVEAWAFAPDPDSAPTIPGPVIRVREGDTVSITLNLFGAPMAHTLHWHGLHVPWDQDGVPYVSQAPLGRPDGGGNGTFTYTYEFKVNQSGTYWYHCHVDTQHHVDMGMYGAFIVDPADASQDLPYDHEAIVFVDEWDKSHIHSSPQSDQLVARSGQPEETLDNTYAQGRDYYQQAVLTQAEGVYANARNHSAVPAPGRDAAQSGTPGSLLRENRTWYPFTYPAYYAEYDTFLLNGKAYPLTQPILADPGKTLRIRLIHAGNELHSMHLHGHHFLVTHADGFKLASPYYKDTLLIAPGERYDIYVKLDNPGPWMFHDHMSQNEQNDHISPGGMSTMLCYSDGWARADLCDPAMHHGKAPTTLEISTGLVRHFQGTQNAAVAAEFTGRA